MLGLPYIENFLKILIEHKLSETVLFVRPSDRPFVTQSIKNVILIVAAKTIEKLTTTRIQNHFLASNAA